MHNDGIRFILVHGDGQCHERIVSDLLVCTAYMGMATVYSFPQIEKCFGLINPLVNVLLGLHCDWCLVTYNLLYPGCLTNGAFIGQGPV